MDCTSVIKVAPSIVHKIVVTESPVIVIKTNLSSTIPGERGLPGVNGADGQNGADGLSAYQVALANGFVGNEAAWLASLKGAKGDPGADGADGTNGIDGTNGVDGADGQDGADGLSAYQVAVNNGFVGNEAAWLTSLKGAKGDKGDQGDPGADGQDGADGTNGTDGADAPLQVFVQSAEPVVAPGTAFVWLKPDAGDGDDYLLQMGVGL